MLSPAKINLTLRVCGLRADGFHEIESLVARVGWGDDVQVRRRGDSRVELRCLAADGVADISGIPIDERNLAVRAARSLAESAAAAPGADIELTKRIPAGAGLGGGSSNAATTLRALNSLWECGYSVARLCDIGAQIGSDVPLFLRSPLCLIRGRGDRVEDRAERVGNFAVLILPALHCSTPAVYRAWDEMNAKSRTADRDDVPIESIVARRRSAAELMPLLFNDLELPAFRLLPELAALRDECECLAGGAVRMTGSGAALFRLFDNRADAEQLADNITQHIGVQVIVAPLAGAAERGLGR